jgi:hypothetical protein
VVRCLRMYERAPNVHGVSDSRALAHFLARYREPSCTRAALELAITAVPFVLIWILMWATLDMGYWICLLLAVPAAGFRKSLGEDIANSAFSEWLSAESTDGHVGMDRNAAAIQEAIESVVLAGKARIPRSGFFVRRGRGCVIVEQPEA